MNTARQLRASADVDDTESAFGARLEREIDRLHALADAASKRRIALHPDPIALGR